MPETTLTVRWPDNSTASYYSPSTVVHAHLPAGEALPLDEFIARSREAFEAASDRVRAIYGFACTGAAASLAQLERDAQQHATAANPIVTVVSRAGATTPTR